MTSPLSLDDVLRLGPLKLKVKGSTTVFLQPKRKGSAESLMVRLPPIVANRHFWAIIEGDRITLLMTDESQPEKTKSRHPWRVELTAEQASTFLSDQIAELDKRMAKELAPFVARLEPYTQEVYVLIDPPFQPDVTRLVPTKRRGAFQVDLADAPPARILTWKAFCGLPMGKLGLVLARDANQRLVSPFLAFSHPEGGLVIGIRGLLALLRIIRAPIAELLGRIPGVEPIPANELDEVMMKTVGFVVYQAEHLRRAGQLAPPPEVEMPSEVQVREAAYYRWKARRGAVGSAVDDWLEAERLLRWSFLPVVR